MKIRTIFFAAALSSLVSVAQATIIKDSYIVTLTAGTGYTAGEQLTINATYDDTANLVHAFGDGVNGVAQFGAGDDTINGTLTAASMGYARASDALITIDGLKSFSPFSARDAFSVNSSWTYFSGGEYGVHYLADHLKFDFVYYNDTKQTTFILRDYFSDSNGNQNAYEAQASGIGFANKIIATPTAAVPEPETYALMLAGLGLIGFAARQRRN